jgi:hypothetical protein
MPIRLDTMTELTSPIPRFGRGPCGLEWRAMRLLIDSRRIRPIAFRGSSGFLRPISIEPALVILDLAFESQRRRIVCSRGALACAAAIVFGFAFASAHAAMVKCVDSNGKVSYQDPPCASSASESAVQFQAPPPPGPSPQAKDLAPVPANVHGRARIPSDGDFRGPREAWQRLAHALSKGDRDAALKELTPSAQQRYGDMLDKLTDKSKPVEIDHLGAVRSVRLTGNSLATITLTRKKVDGTYAYDVMLMRGADGKWRVDTM